MHNRLGQEMYAHIPMAMHNFASMELCVDAAKGTNNNSNEREREKKEWNKYDIENMDESQMCMLT